MADVLHQQVTNRHRDKISRNGEIGPGPCDCLKKTEVVLPFTYHSRPHQLPLRQVPQKPDALGRLLKWAIKLSQFEIEFQTGPAIKGQALTNFITEFYHKPDERPEETPGHLVSKIPKWGMYVDGSSNDGGLGVSLILISPEGHRMHCTLRFGFKASNNEVEYKALIAGLKLAKEMKIESLEIFSDS